jgi:hypothetical protein
VLLGLGSVPAGCTEPTRAASTAGLPDAADGQGPLPDGRPEPPPPPPPTYAPTFDAILTEIFEPTCAGAFCHIDAELGFEVAGADRTYETLMEVTHRDGECGATGLRRVVPGKPEESLLWLKLTDPPCGRKMPLLFNPNLDPRELEQIRLWIMRGAPRRELGDAGAPGADAGPRTDSETGAPPAADAGPRSDAGHD